MKIKQFAEKFQLSTDTVRYYEKEGLLHPQKLNNGYRVYDGTCEQTMKFILVLRQLGFTLQEINYLLTLEKNLYPQSVMKKRYNYFLQRLPILNSSCTFISMHDNRYS